VADNQQQILVVDDYFVNQELLKEILISLEYAVDVAASGQEALLFLKRKNYDLVFMDIQMPEMDGYETTKKIRALERDHRSTIVAVTASVHPEDKQKCLDVGCDSYISKPYKIQNIEQVLDQWLKK